MGLTCLFPSFLGLQATPLDPSLDFHPVLSVWNWSMKNMLRRWKGLVLLNLKYLLGDFWKIHFGLIQCISFDQKKIILASLYGLFNLFFFNLEIQVTLFHEKWFFVTTGWKVFLDAVWPYNAKVKCFIWLLWGRVYEDAALGWSSGHITGLSAHRGLGSSCRRREGFSHLWKRALTYSKFLFLFYFELPRELHLNL